MRKLNCLVHLSLRMICYDRPRHQMFVDMIEHYGNITVDGEEYTDPSVFEDPSDDATSYESDGEIHGHHSEVVHHIGPITHPQIHSESSEEEEEEEEDSGVVSNGGLVVSAPVAAVGRKLNQMKISQPQVKEYYRIAFCDDFAKVNS